MTVYEVAQEKLGKDLELLASLGLINRTLPHQIFVYSQYQALLEKGISKMQALTEISERLYVSEAGLSSIIQKLGRVV